MSEVSLKYIVFISCINDFEHLVLNNLSTIEPGLADDVHVYEWIHLLLLLWFTSQEKFTINGSRSVIINRFCGYAGPSWVHDLKYDNHLVM